jgi:hypothetical protein
MVTSNREPNEWAKNIAAIEYLTSLDAEHFEITLSGPGHELSTVPHKVTLKCRSECDQHPDKISVEGASLLEVTLLLPSELAKYETREGA